MRELTTKDNNEQTTSEDVLVWAKRIEVQWAQAAILNDITKSQKFDKFKMAQGPKTKQDVETTHQCITNGHANIVVEVMCPGSVQHMEKHVQVAGKWATSKRYAGVGGTTWFMKWKLRWHRNHKKKE